YLHEELDGAIRTADLSKERESNSIESRRTSLLRAWATEHGPEQSWERESQTFLEYTLSAVQTALGATNPPDGIGGASTQIDLTRLKTAPSQRYRTSTQDILQEISKVVGLGTPVVTGIVAAAGLISGAVLVVPASLTLAAGLAWGLIKRSKAR